MATTGEVMKLDSMVIAYTKFSKKPSKADTEKLTDWLKVKTKTENIRLVVQ